MLKSNREMKTPRIHGIAALAAVALLSGLIAPVRARADTVSLKKGGSITGVILSESENSIEIKSNLGTIILSRGAVKKIEKSPAGDNAALESQWKKEKDEFTQKAKETRRYEDEQRAKGMVKTEAGWVPAEKAEEADKKVAKEKEQEELEKAQEQQKKDLQDMDRRIKEMEARLEQRQRDLDSREQQLGLREQNLLLQQQNLQRQAEQLSREKQDRPQKIFAVPRIDVYPPPPAEQR